MSMEPTSTASTRLGGGALWALFAANVYRAATQSITTDEGLTYNLFVHPQLKDTLHIYDANNHVLNTLLTKVSLTVLRLSEISLRLRAFSSAVSTSGRFTGWLAACSARAVSLSRRLHCFP